MDLASPNVDSSSLLNGEDNGRDGADGLEETNSGSSRSKMDFGLDGVEDSPAIFLLLFLTMSSSLTELSAFFSLASFIRCLRTLFRETLSSLNFSISAIRTFISASLRRY